MPAKRQSGQGQSVDGIVSNVARGRCHHRACHLAAAATLVAVGFGLFGCASGWSATIPSSFRPLPTTRRGAPATAPSFPRRRRRPRRRRFATFDALRRNKQNQEASMEERRGASASYEPTNAEDRIRFRIIQINDVYKLDNFPHFKTLVDHYKSELNPDGTPAADCTIVVLAGDFLGPSLLSSLDQGTGFVDIMSAVGVTHVCLGNHETDVKPEALPERIRNSTFKWVNSNMRDLDDKINVTTPAFDVITVSKRGSRSHTVNDGGECTRRVALLGLLTEDPSLYREGAFGGATLEPVVECTERMLQELRRDSSIDLIVPLTHQSIDCDRHFAKKFTGDSFPVVCGGHDHDVYIEEYSNCHIVKTGMNAVNTAIIDIDWPLVHIVGGGGDSKSKTGSPSVCVNLVQTQSFPPDPDVARRVEFHERVIRDLEMAKLFRIDTKTEAFTTAGNRLRSTTGSKVLTTAIRMGMRAQCAIVNAGSIRGSKTYDASWFTWSDLKAELPFPTEVTTVSLPGNVLSDTIAYSRRGSYEQPPRETGGFMQTCDMIRFNDEMRCVESIRGEPFDADKLYLTALPVSALKGMDRNVPLMRWASEHLDAVHLEAGRPGKMVVVELFAALLWLELGSFADIDKDQDGVISQSELKEHAERKFGREFANLVVESVMAVADVEGDGCIHPHEMLMTRFIAADMMKHICTREEVDAMNRLAAELLDLPTSHPDVHLIARKVLEKLDKKKNGRMTREEAVEALGKVISTDLL